MIDKWPEIEKLRLRIAGLLNQEPPRRSEAKRLGVTLGLLMLNQLKRENKIVKKLNERREHALA